MPSDWTAPRDWSTSEFVTSTIMNTHVRDNLLWLKDNPQLSSTTVTTTQTGSITVATLSAVVISADVSAVYVECWATSFGWSGAFANPSTATLTVSETTAGTIITSEHKDSESGTDSWHPLYARSVQLAWGGSTRTVTMSMTATNATARLAASVASPIVLRLMRAY